MINIEDNLRVRIMKLIGAVRVLGMRALGLFGNLTSIFNTFLLIYLVLSKANPVEIITHYWLWIVGGFIACVIYVWADVYIFLPSENEFSMYTNPPLKNIQTDVRQIKKDIEVIKAKLGE